MDRDSRNTDEGLQGNEKIEQASLCAPAGTVRGGAGTCAYSRAQTHERGWTVHSGSRTAKGRR